MRVLQMVDSLEIGGAQKLIVTFAQVARARGIRLTVLSLDALSDPTIAHELESQGAELVWFPARRLFNLPRIVQLTRYLKQERFDLIQTHLQFANVLGILCGRMAGIPVIPTLHSAGRDVRRLQGARDRIEYAFLRWGTRHVLAVGQSVAETHQPWLGKQAITVLPNAVPERVTLSPTQRLSIRRELCGDPQRPLLIAVGRLTLPKGYPDLLEAFAVVHQHVPQAMLVIAGDGELRAQLSAQIERAELHPVVRLLGSRSDIPALLAASDLFVSSSHWEGLPLAVLEAMMSGLPIVATAVGDTPQVVLPECGQVVPPQQPQTLAEAVLQLLADPARRAQMGAAARAQALAHYSIDAWGDRLLALFAQVAPAQPPTSYSSVRPA